MDNEHEVPAWIAMKPPKSASNHHDIRAYRWQLWLAQKTVYHGKRLDCVGRKMRLGEEEAH